MSTLENVTVLYSSLKEEDQYGNLSLVVELTDDQVKQIEAEGGKTIISTKNGKPFFRFSQKPTKKDGSPNPVMVNDRFGDEFEGAYVPSGTKVDVSYNPYSWSFKGRTGIKFYINEVKVNDDIMVTGKGKLSYDKPVASTAEESPF